MTTLNTSPSLVDLHAGFQSLLSRIELHARIFFRYIPCAQKKSDAVAETVALAWKWYVRLARRGKDATEFGRALATFAARAVKCGRRLCGMQKSKDVFSALAQQRHSFVVKEIGDRDSRGGTPWEEALLDNQQSPVPDQVCFRMDFSRWRDRRSYRQRRIIDDLMAGERTLDLANKYHLSPGRISQLRRAFHDSWEQFCA